MQMEGDRPGPAASAVFSAHFARRGSDERQPAWLAMLSARHELRGELGLKILHA